MSRDENTKPPRIMLDARSTFKERKTRLMAKAITFKKALNCEIGCPKCGDEGPHESDGTQLRCRTCGEHVEEDA